LDIDRIKKIKEAAGVPIVLHGGSGIKDSDFTAAINAGISIIHINTEIRIAWREGLEAAFKNNPEEITPYKLLPGAVNEIKKIVRARLQLFNKLR
ncbi:MAG: fructose-bisphosphate aldolase, class II, partial [Parcubacteria group bacterium Athens0714_26]